MNLDWGALVTSILGSFGMTAVAWGRMNSKLEQLDQSMGKTSDRIHSLTNEIQAAKLKQIQDINELRQEIHEDFVTYRQLEDLKRDMSETRDDIKKLLEMVATLAARK